MPSCSSSDLRESVTLAAPAVLAGCPSRVVPLDVGCRRVWLKRARPIQPRPLHRLQRLLAALIPVRLLRYTGGLSGQAALDQEMRIIGRLGRRGVRVPEIIAHGEGWIALADLGPSLEKTLLRASDRSQALHLAADGAWALIRLHRNGGWHGNPQVRNLVGPPAASGSSISRRTSAPASDPPPRKLATGSLKTH